MKGNTNKRGNMIEEKAIFLVRLAIELRKGKTNGLVLINGRYR